jgi:hypothetical protein
VFATRHTRQAVGFSVIETRKKLKAEYAAERAGDCQAEA